LDGAGNAGYHVEKMARKMNFMIENAFRLSCLPRLIGVIDNPAGAGQMPPASA
jgi:hypothetical protein